MNFDWHRLFTPSAWAQNYPTCWEWDKALNELLDKHEVELQGAEVQIGPVRVWVGNFPYSYGQPWRVWSVLPSLKTRERLRESVRGALAEYAAKGYPYPPKK